MKAITLRTDKECHSGFSTMQIVTIGLSYLHVRFQLLLVLSSLLQHLLFFSVLLETSLESLKVSTLVLDAEQHPGRFPCIGDQRSSLMFYYTPTTPCHISTSVAGLARLVSMDVWQKREEPPDNTDGAGSSRSSESVGGWSPCLYSVEGETIYDFAW